MVWRGLSEGFVGELGEDGMLIGDGMLVELEVSRASDLSIGTVIVFLR